MANEIVELTDVQWALKRGQNYIGSLKEISGEDFLYNKDTKKFEFLEFNYVPGLIKIINEIIDNSIDVAIKSKFKYGNKIDIIINADAVAVRDNGYGIPVVKTNEGLWSPNVAWGKPRTGSNFDDEKERTSGGMNGIGSFATSVYSKYFKGETDDGKNKLTVEFFNNLSETKITGPVKSKKQGTIVYFEPDLERFSKSKIDKTDILLIYQRVLNISMIYPEIDFTFNKIELKLDLQNFLLGFGEQFELLNMGKYQIAVLPNNTSDFKFTTYINQLHISKGGNHIDYISNKVISAIRNKLIKKYKNIKPGDIKNKLMLIVYFRDFDKPSFDSQNKEGFTSSQKEIGDYLNIYDEEIKSKWEGFLTKLSKNKDLLLPIIDLYEAKLKVEENKKLKADVNTKDLPEKYWPAVKRKDNLFIAEGDSAVNSIIAEIGRDYNGFFPLKGVPLNVLKEGAKVYKNSEIKQLASILKMNLTKENEELSYKNIIISTDQDVDGAHITGILIGLLYKYVPKYLFEGRVYRFITPLIVVYKNKNIEKFLFNIEEINEFLNLSKNRSLNFKYKKGLGSITPQEWIFLFDNYNLEDLLISLDFKDSENPDEDVKLLLNWLMEDSEFRKNEIVENFYKFELDLT